MRYACLLLLICLAVGCSKEDDKGVRISGTITFKGKNVPAGRIYFDPDPKSNPGGKQGHADIKDGKYDTSLGGKPPSPGGVTLRIDGFSAPTPENSDGVPLFVGYEEKAELSGSSVEKNVTVPESAAKSAPQGNGPSP